MKKVLIVLLVALIAATSVFALDLNVGLGYASYLTLDGSFGKFEFGGGIGTNYLGNVVYQHKYSDDTVGWGDCFKNKDNLNILVKGFGYFKFDTQPLDFGLGLSVEGGKNFYWFEKSDDKESAKKFYVNLEAKLEYRFNDKHGIFGTIGLPIGCATAGATENNGWAWIIGKQSLSNMVKAGASISGNIGYSYRFK